MGGCRNCGATVSDLGFIGEVAPFVLKRVLDLEIGSTQAVHPVKRFLRRIKTLRRIVERIYGSAVLTEIQVCKACSFVQTKEPLPDSGLAKLYADYRSDSYNRERIRYEPEYASISSQVGNSEQEVNTRVNGLTAWLTPRIKTGVDFSMLDFGGADGRFLPQLDGPKYVFDISDIEPVPGVHRIRSEESLGTYSYVQIAHVLEHVPYPLALTVKAASYLETAGYLYIEVPQDLTDEYVGRLVSGDRDVRVTIHEHINFYTATSIAKLLESAGLEQVEVEVVPIDIGWIKAKIIRALGRKKSG